MTDGGFDVHFEHFPGQIKKGFGMFDVIVDLEQVHRVAQPEFRGHGVVETEVGTAKVGNACEEGKRKR